MTKVYLGVSSIPLPVIDWSKDFEEIDAQEDKYLEDLCAYAKVSGKGAEAGQVLRFPYADGYAQYVVLSLLSPVKLIHVATGDAWDYPYINRLTAADLKKELRRDEARAALFSKKDLTTS